MVRFWNFVIGLFLLFTFQAHAVDLASGMNFDGVLMTAGGVAITAPTAVDFQVMNPSQSCILYAEEQTVSPDASGNFSVIVGSPVGSTVRTSSDSNFAWSKIFSNESMLLGKQLTSGSCPYAPAAGDGRTLRVLIGGVSLGSVVLNPVPAASVADTLQGHPASDFLSSSSVINAPLNFGPSGSISFTAPNSNVVTLKGAISPGGSYSFTLPNGVGSNGQVLSTDGSGNMSWVNLPAAGGGSAQTSASNFTFNSNNNNTATGGFNFQSNGTNLMTIGNDGTTAINGATAVGGPLSSGALTVAGPETVNGGLTVNSSSNAISENLTGTATHIINGSGSTANSLLTLSSNSTSAPSGQQGINIGITGTNGTSSITRFGIYSSVTSTGTLSTNVAGFFSASGATNNLAISVPNGSVGIGTSAPSALLDVESTATNAAVIKTSGTTPALLVSSTNSSTSAPAMTISTASTIGPALTVTSGSTTNTGTTAAVTITTQSTSPTAPALAVTGTTVSGALKLGPAGTTIYEVADVKVALTSCSGGTGGAGSSFVCTGSTALSNNTGTPTYNPPFSSAYLTACYSSADPSKPIGTGFVTGAPPTGPYTYTISGVTTSGSALSSAGTSMFCMVTSFVL